MAEDKKQANNGKKEGHKGSVYNHNGNGGFVGQTVYDNQIAELIVNINGDKIDPEFLEQLSKFLKDKRKETKMTQKDVAEKTGIDLKYYQKIESSKIAIQPNMTTLNKIIKGFGYEGISVLAKRKSGFESNILKTSLKLDPHSTS